MASQSTSITPTAEVPPLKEKKIWEEKKVKGRKNGNWKKITKWGVQLPLRNSDWH